MSGRTKLKRLGMAALILFVAWLFLSGTLNRPVRLMVAWDEGSDGIAPADPYPWGLLP